MNESYALKTAMNDAMRTTESAAALGQQLTGGDLLRASAARRLSDAHERLVREAKVLADDAANLVVTLQCDGIGARLSGHAFARTARKVSGALIRLAECREIFQAIQAQQNVAGLLTPAATDADDAEATSAGDADESED
jgi:hypothetical protein